ncbi:hypothetical protein [Bradyrhizobium sp. CCBAU 45389]|uniref:hypothetical protein n=1 Tax=Bradyrhizobium sp. CCBAU 45389 TaxID=858429 RepID=UPI0023050E42|nr:hypothetical protein [Bradyrhizobium sp. CCBAU 45389]
MHIELRKLPTLLLPIGIAAILVATPESALAAKGSSNGAIIAGISMNVIEQNTPGYSQAYPAGVPNTSSWCNGTSKPEAGGPPSDFTAVTGLASVFPKFGATASANPNGKILVSNSKTYVRLRATQEWILVQDQSENEIVGAHFDAMTPKSLAVQMKAEVQADGDTLVDGPPVGRNDLMWMVRRGNFAAGSVDSVYVQMDMKTTDPNMKVVANVGADWWRAPDAPHSAANNRGAGNSNWVELSPDWSTLFFFSGSAAKFAANPPPPLAELPLSAQPTSTQHAANSPSPCLRILAPR